MTSVQSLVLVLRTSCYVSDLFADVELTQISVQEKSPGFCCCIPQLGTGLRTVLKLHSDVIQQAFVQCLLSLRQYVGILGDSKASKGKLPLTKISHYLRWSRNAINIKNIRETLPGTSVKVKTKIHMQDCCGSKDSPGGCLGIIGQFYTMHLNN